MFILDYCDYSQFNPVGDRIYRPKGLGMYLFLRFYRPMRLVFADEVIISKPNACILFSPDQPQDYTSVHEFQNSYIHFTVEDEYFSGYELPINEIFYPNDLSDIDRLFRQLQKEFLSTHPLKKEMTAALLQQLLIESSRQLMSPPQTKEDQFLHTAFKQLRYSILTECEKRWSVTELCRSVHLEKSQFYLYYEKFFSVSPKADLLTARMNKAKYLLSNQALLIHEVAENCGFSSASHFSRQFKRSCGYSPKEYQEMLRKAGQDRLGSTEI